MSVTSTLSYIGLYPQGGFIRPLTAILRWGEVEPGKGAHCQHRWLAKHALVYSGASLEMYA
jgi:hypothetical protein